jgi:hypothetical protein
MTIVDETSPPPATTSKQLSVPGSVIPASRKSKAKVPEQPRPEPTVRLVVELTQTQAASLANSSFVVTSASEQRSIVAAETGLRAVKVALLKVIGF